jgi:hypothetical protein
MAGVVTNCPFYGRYLLMNHSERVPAMAFALFDSGGNQCALINDAYSPCYLEVEEKPVDWRECERVAAIRIG